MNPSTQTDSARWTAIKQEYEARQYALRQAELKRNKQLAINVRNKQLNQARRCSSCIGTGNRKERNLLSRLQCAINKQKRDDMISMKPAARKRYYRVGRYVYDLVQHLVNSAELSKSSSARVAHLNAARKVSNAYQLFDRSNRESIEHHLADANKHHLEPFIREVEFTQEILWGSCNASVQEVAMKLTSAPEGDGELEVVKTISRGLAPKIERVINSLKTLKLMDQGSNGANAQKRYKLYLRRMNNLIGSLTKLGYASRSNRKLSRKERASIFSMAVTDVEYLQAKHTAFLNTTGRLRRQVDRANLTLL